MAAPRPTIAPNTPTISSKAASMRGTCSVLQPTHGWLQQKLEDEGKDQWQQNIRRDIRGSQRGKNEKTAEKNGLWVRSLPRLLRLVRRRRTLGRWSCWFLVQRLPRTPYWPAPWMTDTIVPCGPGGDFDARVELMGERLDDARAQAGRCELAVLAGAPDAIVGDRQPPP